MNKLLLSFLLSWPLLTFGQFSDGINSDRPGQSISPLTVGKKAIQFQAGYSHEALKLEDSFLPEVENANNSANAKIRFGILERTEISGQITGGQNTYNAESIDFVQLNDGIQLIGVGVRQNILAPGKGGLRLGAELESRWTETNDEIEYADLLLTVSGVLNIGERFSATANSGYGFESEELFFTANLGMTVSEKVGVFAEYYPILGNVQNADGESYSLKRSYLHAGGYFVADPSFVIDFLAGYMIAGDEYELWDSAEGFLIQVGFTARMDWREQ